MARLILSFRGNIIEIEADFDQTTVQQLVDTVCRNTDANPATLKLSQARGKLIKCSEQGKYSLRGAGRY